MSIDFLPCVWGSIYAQGTRWKGNLLVAHLSLGEATKQKGKRGLPLGFVQQQPNLQEELRAMSELQEAMAGGGAREPMPIDVDWGDGRID